MNEILNQTLAQIVREHYQTSIVFEKYHLDFCCKGKRPLAEAISEKHLSSDQVVQELNEVITKSANKDAAILNYITLSQLCDYIVATHHAYVRQSSEQILTYLEKIAAKHGERHPELLQVLNLFTELKVEMRDHLFKEENILFPRIKELEKQNAENSPVALPVTGFIETPIAVLEHEHDNAGRLLEQIRAKTNNYLPPADACTTYRVAFESLHAFEADLHQHVHMEINILFPKAVVMVRKLNHLSFN